MSRRALLVCLVLTSLLILGVMDRTTSYALVHPGIMNSQAELNFWVSKVAASQQPWLAAFNALEDFSAYAPQSTNPIAFGSSPDTPGSQGFRTDCYAAYTSTLQFFGTGTQARANKAIQILNNMATITGGSGAHMNLALEEYGNNCVYAAELLKYATPDSGWSTADENAFGTWLKTFVEPGMNDTDISNGTVCATDNDDRLNGAIHGASMRMAIGVFTNTQPLYDQGLRELKDHVRFYIGCQFDQTNYCDLPHLLPPGFSFQVCRAGNTGPGCLSGGDLIHTQTAMEGLTHGAEIAKHQGVDLYGYKHTTTPPAPTDSMGLEDALLYLDQWIGFNQGRAGSSSTGWPCATPLAQVSSGAAGFWMIAGNHYGNSGQIDDVAAYRQTGDLSRFDAFGGLTHNYNKGGGPVVDTTPPTTPGSPTAVVTAGSPSSSITLTWTDASDAVGVTVYRIDHCTTAGCTPTTKLVDDSASPFVHLGLAQLSLHRYTISALDAAGNRSPVTAVVEATTAAAQPPPTGNLIYMSTTGNNANPGTIGSPKATLNGACSIASAGDTIIMRGGTYALSGTHGTSCPSGTSWNNPLTIRPAFGETVLLNGPATIQFGQQYGTSTPGVPKSYIILQGEKDRNTYNAATSEGGKTLILHAVQITTSNGSAHHLRLKDLELKHWADDVGGTDGCNYCELIDLNMHHNGRQSHDHAVYSHGSYMLIDGGEYHHNGGYGIQFHNEKSRQSPPKCVGGQIDQGTGGTTDGCGMIGNTIRNVRFHANGNGGAVLNGPGGGYLVYNTVSYRGNPGAGCGANHVALCTGAGGAIQVGARGQFYNMTLYGNAPGGTGPNAAQLGLKSSTDNSEVRNILCSGTSRACVTVDPGATGVIQTPILDTATPLFVNAAAGDFHLKSGSPAINGGLNLAGLFKTDLDGATRPATSAWDIGAYEFGGAPPICTKPGGDCDAPSVPTNVALTLVGTTQIDGNWPDSTGSPTGYRVYRCDGDPALASNCAGTALVLSPTVSAFTNPGLTANRRYLYEVSAVDANGNESARSNAVTMTTTTPVVDTIAPTVPGPCTATADAWDQITFTCGASTDNVEVTSYLTQRCQGVACTPSVQVDQAGSPTHVSLDLAPSTVYGFSMAARDAVGNISSYSTPTIYATTPAQPTVAETVLLLNNDVQDASGQGHHGTPTSITFDAINKVEGTEAGVWNAGTDKITVPMTDFPNPNQLTIAMNVRPTAFSGRKFLIGHTTVPAHANMIQLCINATGVLQLGLGSTGGCGLNTQVMQLSLNTYYYLVLRLNNGTYTIDVNDVRQASGTYVGLTTFAPTLTIGGYHVSTEGWIGQMDAVKIVGRVWSDTEVSTDCALYVPGCVPPPPPVFDPFVMASGMQGDGIVAANNKQLMVTMTGIPDPHACLDLTQFFLAYDQQRPLVQSCSLTGSTMTLIAATPPPSPNTVIALTYVPSGQQIPITNNTVDEPATATDLRQVSWWCRPDKMVADATAADAEPWLGLPNDLCKVSSPGILNLRVDLINTAAVDSPEQNYSLFCDTDLEDQVPAMLIAEDPTTPLGVFYHQSTLGILDGTPRTPVLPNPGGITPVIAGTFQRNDVAPIAPVLGPQERTEFEFSLAFAPGLPRGTVFSCGLRPTASAAPLAQTTLARIRIGQAQFIVQ